MQPAAEAMRDALSYVVIDTPTVPVFANVTAGPETDPDTIRNLLVEQEVLTPEEIDAKVAEVRARFEAEGLKVAKETVPW